MPDVYDGAWRLFSWDPATQRTTWVLHHDGKMTFRTDYPVDDIIKDNQEARAESAGQRFGEWSRVASVPMNVFFEQLADPLKQKDSRYIRKFLNDSVNFAWRTKEGNL